MDELNKRIIELMVKFNHSKSSLATELGVSLPQITHITTGRNKPGIEFLQKVLSRFTDINPLWLILGEGTMLKEEPDSVDVTPILTKLGTLDALVNHALEVHSTMLAYHKLLLDEVLHLQEMSIQVTHASHDLGKLKEQLEVIKGEIRDINNKVK